VWLDADPTIVYVHVDVKQKGIDKLYYTCIYSYIKSFIVERLCCSVIDLVRFTSPYTMYETQYNAEK